MTSGSNATRATLQALVAEARSQQQFSLAERIERVPQNLKQSMAARNRPRNIPAEVEASLAQLKSERTLDDMVLAPELAAELMEFVNEFAEIALLRSHGLEPRHKVLLVGPPGTGKTSLAEALATELKLPFLVVRYDGLIASYLGETASRLRRLTDFVAEQPCVVFFDEFDTVGKERGDTQETGEIKRVVSSLLLQMDALPSHCVIICATNHPELLDRAVWRRFQLRLEVPEPSQAEITEWFNRFRKDYGEDLGVTAEEFVKPLMGMNFSDIEAFTLDIRRKIILSKGNLSPTDAVRSGLTKLIGKRSNLGDWGNSRSADSAHKAPTKRSKSNKGKTSALPQSSLI